MDTSPPPSRPGDGTSNLIPNVARIVRAQYRTALEIIDGPRTIEDADFLAEDAHDYAEMLIDNFEAIAPPSPPLACRKGCSTCCHLRVGTTIPEVIRIANHLKATSAPDELKAIRGRIEEHQERTSRLTAEAGLHVRPPCPLLVDDACSIHAVRPLACRGWNSTDVVRCLDFYNHPEGLGAIPVYRPRREISIAVGEGLQHGIRGAGLESGRVELVAALKIALDDPSAGQRWLGGELAFQAAEIGSFDPAFRERERAALAIPPCL